MRAVGVVMATLTVGLAACAPSAKELGRNSTPRVSNHTENYQEIFRRVSTQARDCSTGVVSSQGSFEVDAQLYSELGYGEIVSYLRNMGTSSYFWTVRIERQGDGSRMVVNALNNLSTEQTVAMLQSWARGDTSCG